MSEANGLAIGLKSGGACGYEGGCGSVFVVLVPIVSFRFLVSVLFSSFLAIGAVDTIGLASSTFLPLFLLMVGAGVVVFAVAVAALDWRGGDDGGGGEEENPGP